MEVVIDVTICVSLCNGYILYIIVVIIISLVLVNFGGEECDICEMGCMLFCNN